MKIIVTSDIHGNIEILNKVRMIEYDASYFLDAGDSQLSGDELHTFLSVKGNMDYFVDLPFVRHVNIYENDIIIYHGNAILNKSEINQNTKIIISGHTHIASIQKFSNIYFINPGSLSRPRDDLYGSYIVIIFDQKTNLFDIKIKRI